MAKAVELIHLEGNDPKWNMPYTPAIKVHSGTLVFLSGVTAGPIYHSHPHIPSEFDYIPEDPVSIRAARASDRFQQGDSRSTKLIMPWIATGLIKHFTPGLTFIARKG